MAGRRRKFDPTIPAHIDQARLPAGIYWDRTGNGRWYVREPHPEGIGDRTSTVATAAARLSDLHSIMESRSGAARRGTVGYVMDQFHESTEFKALAAGTQKSYRTSAAHVRAWKTPMGATLDQLEVDRLTLPTIQRLIERIAKGRAATGPGAGDAIPGQPSKANHLLRYLRRTFAWGMRHGACKTNPAKGAKQVKERQQHTMPAQDAFRAVLAYAYERGRRKAHSAGSCPPYLAPLMELAYLCRLRGIEVVRLSDAHATTEGVLASRVKGSRDNITRWSPRLRAAWDAAVAARTATYARRNNQTRVVPIRAEDRPLFVAQDGGPLSKSGFDSAWQNLMAAAIRDKVIAEHERFSLHGLKHRGVTDSRGNKQQAAGHVSPAMTARYDHEIAIVEPAGPVEFSGEFSGAADFGKPEAT
jgi:site-specific recombinase XerD